jgi:hypothetical protein
MAKVLGEAGRYVSDAAVKRRRGTLTVALILVAALFWIDGLLIGLMLAKAPSRMSPWAVVVITVVLVMLCWAAWKWADRKIDKLEGERVNMLKGASGEVAVADSLGQFPDEFMVINDLTTPFGNLDHVVVGPTGVFVIDTKNWTGVVSSDGKGELLCNGKPTDKQIVRQFVARIMGIQDKVKTLAPGLDPFYQPVFVFPSARVDAYWGTTRTVNCIRKDQLFDYIVEKNFGKKLSKEEVSTIAQAFLALAHMETDFTEKALAKRQPASPIRQ